MAIVEKLINHSPGQTVLSMCDRCGALIGDTELHLGAHDLADKGQPRPSVKDLMAQGIAAAEKRGPGRPPKTPVVPIGDMPDPTDALINDPNKPMPIEL